MRAVVVLLCVIIHVSGSAAEEYPTSYDPCYRSFYSSWELYNWCASGDTWDAYPNPHLGDLDGIRGRDIVSRLEGFCSNITEFGQCLMNDVVTCDDDVKNTVSETVVRAGAVCNGRGEVRNEISQIFLSENPTNDEELDKTFCHEGMQYHDCFNESKEKFGDVNEDVLFRKLKDIVNDDNYLRYYTHAFKCVHDKVLTRCPNNVMTMTVAFYPRTVLPPRIALNVSALLLEVNSS